MTVSANGTTDLAFKIARLVEERGWNQEDFARIANLNRHTCRQILKGDDNRRLRNATVSQCAEALGLSVNELRTQVLERLLPRMHGKPAADDEAIRLLTEGAHLTDLVTWLEKNADRASELSPEEATELLALQEPGGSLERLGVEQAVNHIERRRQLLGRARVLAATDQFAFLEQFVDMLFEKVNRTAK